MLFKCFSVCFYKSTCVCVCVCAFCGDLPSDFNKQTASLSLLTSLILSWITGWGYWKSRERKQNADFLETQMRQRAGKNHQEVSDRRAQPCGDQFEKQTEPTWFAPSAPSPCERWITSEAVWPNFGGKYWEIQYMERKQCVARTMHGHMHGLQYNCCA